ncbi:MAG: TonB-dependent receptor [Sphingobium sp.]|nr:TonB-dependent receptor [Sphingobium sp.]
MKYALPAALAALMLAASAPAQDLNSAEIVVTGSRIEQDGYSRDMPAVGLRRPADFLVQEVTIRGDTRDAKQRSQEIYAMLAKAVDLAARNGVELAYGDYILTPLTAENMKELTLQRDTRPDSERITFLAKVRLSPQMSGKQAQERIGKYIDSVPEVGRAQMDSGDEPTLSIVGPDSYRAQIAAVIGDDARAMAAKIGEGYKVQVEGLNMPVQWTRASASEVLLYIPYKLTIVPQPQ